MGAENKVDTVLIDLNLNSLGKAGRVQIASVIGQFAPKSTLYQATVPLQQAVSDIVAAGADLDAKTKAKEAARQTYLTAVGAEASSQRAFDTTAGVFKAQTQLLCKTAQDAPAWSAASCTGSASAPSAGPSAARGASLSP